MRACRRSFRLAGCRGLAPQAADADTQQFLVAGAEMALIGQELDGGLLRQLGVAVDSRLAKNLGAVPAPQIPVLPKLADLLWDFSSEVAFTVWPLVVIKTVLANTQFDENRHRAGRFADRTGDGVVFAQIERHRFEILPQRQRLLDDPQLRLVLLEDLGEYPGAVQRHGDGRVHDGPPQRQHVRVSAGGRSGVGGKTAEVHQTQAADRDSGLKQEFSAREIVLSVHELVHFLG